MHIFFKTYQNIFENISKHVLYDTFAVPVYQKLGQQLGVKGGDRLPENVLDFAPKIGISPEAARKVLCVAGCTDDACVQ